MTEKQPKTKYQNKISLLLLYFNRIANVFYDPIKKCNESFKPMTVLDENGTLYIHKDHKDIDCQVDFESYQLSKELN